MKLSIRLSKPNKTIAQLLKPTHGLTGPDVNWNGINGAELYYGMGYSNPPNWIGFLSAGTNNPITGLISSGAIALLFVPLSNRYMVFTFGICASKIVVTGFERDFGLKVVLNTVHPDKIKSVDSKTIDTIITNRRTQLSRENKIQDFGFEVDKDLLGAVVGKPSNSNFARIVGGSDNLNISCDITINNFYAKCQEILRAYNSTAYKTNYDWIDNVKPVKDQPTIDTLDRILVSETNHVLSGTANSFLQLASPTIMDLSLIDHFKISGYRSSAEYGLPDFEDFVADLQSKAITTVTLDNLESYKVKAVDSNGAVVSEWSLYDWLVAEVNYNRTRYILSEGSWFEISPAYFTRVDTAFQRIISNRNEYRRVGTTTYENETKYLSNYSVSANEIILDKKLIAIYGSRNTIEPCDIYNLSRQFIHVKDGGASSKLSHLFNQGYVSASAFFGDSKFRSDLKRKLNSKPHLAATISNPVQTTDYTIVYRILKKGTAFQLPFFTKIVVNESYRKIKSMGYRFRLEWVQKT